jgi:hypothetical protein
VTLSPLRSALIVLLVALAGAGVEPAHAQTRPAPLELGVRAGDRSVVATLGRVLSAPGVRTSLEAGLPVRVTVVTELWRVGFFDAQAGRHEWRASVMYDPLSRTYRLETAEGASVTAASLEMAELLLIERLRVPLRPVREGRYYYLGRLEVETLSLSDLDELRRWLRGDLAAAVDGEGRVGGALGRGLQRLLIRVLRLPAESFQARSPTFSHTP